MTYDVDPAEVAADMLREALPGFEASIVASRGQIEIRGGLPIKGALSAESVYHMVPRPPVIDNVFRDFREIFAPEDPAARAARRAEQTTALKLYVAPMVGALVEEVQGFAIHAVGLEPVIAHREEDAHHAGVREGHAIGLAEGIEKGRAEAADAFSSMLAPVASLLVSLGLGGDDAEEE